MNVLVLWRLSGSSGEDPATPAAAVLTLPNIPPEYLTSLPESDQEWIRLLRAQAARHHQSAQVIIMQLHMLLSPSRVAIPIPMPI